MLLRCKAGKLGHKFTSSFGVKSFPNPEAWLVYTELVGTHRAEGDPSILGPEDSELGRGEGVGGPTAGKCTPHPHPQVC